MERFYVRFCLILGILLSGYAYPTFVHGLNMGVNGYSYTVNSGRLSVGEQQYTDQEQSDYQSYSTGSVDLPDSGSSDNGGGLFRSGPPGPDGDPISGVEPIGFGLPILLGLSFFYLLYITLFNFIKKKKMNKAFIAFLVLLTASMAQTYGQVSVPLDAKSIYKQDFGGNGPNTGTGSFPANAAASFFDGAGIYTSLGFLANSNNPGNIGTKGQYTLSKNTAGVTPGAWWGQGVAVGSATPTNVINDHTSPNDVNSGYMMIINASSDLDVFFKYPINGICPNTNLYFSFWAANMLKGRPANQVDPIFAAEVQDINGNVLARLDSITPPLISSATGLSAANNYGWNNYVLEFRNTNYSTIYFVLINECNNTVGNDLTLDDIEIFKMSPDITVSSPTSPTYYYCEGLPMDMAANYDDPTGVFEGNAEFMWLYSTDDFVSDSTFVAADSICSKPAKAGWYKVIVGAEGNTDPTNGTYDQCCSASQSVEVHMIPPTTVLYWKSNAVNQNWNDYRNWQFADRSASLYPPNRCTNVHIPGNSNMYPSLDEDHSGPLCACNNIWFHFGGLIGQPQLLQYDSAYVQYNFGKGDPDYSAPPMTRGVRWYALAAPLQKMASGDFGFGGYPAMWQQSFKTSYQGGYGTLTGQWYSPENTNSWGIANQNNAIVIFADNESPDFTKGLDGLNGILEIPYYENPATSPYHRGFYQDGTISYFPYYFTDKPGLPFIDESDPKYIPPGSIDRGNQGYAYKFIFEAENQPFHKTAPGEYTMPINGTGDIVMIGNPFMSNLDFDKFVEDNSGLFDSYYLYNGSAFGTYSYTAGSSDPSLRYIAPLQAFFIQPPTSSTSTILTFNANNEAVAPDTPNTRLRASTADSGGKADVLYIQASSDKGTSWLTLSMQNVKKENQIFILSQDYPEVPQLYATDDMGQKNSIQFEGGYVNSVPLGLFSSSSDQITLTVTNKDKLSVDKLMLFDKSLGKNIDLLANDSYTFQNTPDTPDRFTLTIEKTMTGISSPEVERPVRVGVTGNTLFVNAGSAIEDVSVITLQGITIAKDSNIEQPSYTKSLELPSGLYLVSVKLKTGATSVAKVVIK